MDIVAAWSCQKGLFVLLPRSGLGDDTTKAPKLLDEPGWNTGVISAARL